VIAVDWDEVELPVAFPPAIRTRPSGKGAITAPDRREGRFGPAMNVPDPG
jgi:hypothetical protein